MQHTRDVLWCYRICNHHERRREIFVEIAGNSSVDLLSGRRMSSNL
jgi:hypothetical protein